MADAVEVEQLLSRIESSADVDKRVAGLQALEAELSRGGEVPDPDGITSALKATIKNAHQALSTASLSFLPMFISLLCPPTPEASAAHDAHHIRVVILAVLPTILEKTGDQKERVRDAARKALVALGRAAQAVSTSSHGSSLSTKGKEMETPLAIFERIFRDNGLGAKFARVKEQSTLALQALRQAAEKFPVRPFLPALVDSLSDADASVREASRTTIVALFLSASPAAKSDLKKELEKRGTRKQIADVILKEVLGGGGRGSAPTSTLSVAPSASEEQERALSPLPHQEGGSHVTSPDVASPDERPPMPASNSGDDDVSPVYIASKHDLERTFATFAPYFEGKETEHNWANREQSIVKMRGMLKAGVYDQFGSHFAAGVKGMLEGILKTLASLRTTVAIHTTSLICELAKTLGDDLEPCVDGLLTALLRMAGFTKKIAATASQQAASAIFVNVTFHHQYLVLVWQGLQEKMIATRVAMCEHLNTILNTHGVHRKHAVEGHGGLDILDKCLRRSLPDQNKDVRAKARDAYWKFARIWPAEAEKMLETLDAPTRKQVVASAPSTVGSSVASEVKPKPVQAARRAGPSSAILAAKRAAAAKAAAEKKEREDAEAAAAAAAAAAPTPQRAAPASASTSRAPPTSAMSPRSGIRTEAEVVPLPPSPSSRTSNISESETASPRVPSTSSSHSARASPTPRTRLPVGVSSPPSMHSSRTAPHRSRTTSTSSSASARSVTSRPSPRTRSAQVNEDMDDTVQLTAPADMSVDLMSFESPLKAQSQAHAQGQGQGEAGALRRRRTEENVALEAQQASSSAAHLLNLLDPPSTPTRGAPTAASPASTVVSSPAPGSVRRSALPRPISMLHPGPSPLGNGLPANAATSTPVRHAPSRSIDGALDDVQAAPETPFGAQPIRPGGSDAAAAWFHRKSSRLETDSPMRSKPESKGWVAALDSGTADLRTLRRLAKLSADFRLPAASGSAERYGELTKGPTNSNGHGNGNGNGNGNGSGARNKSALGLEKLGEPEGLDDADGMEAWQDGGLFEKLLSALSRYLENSKSEELRTAALVLLHRLVDNQFALFVSSGKEMDLLTLVFSLRREKAKSLSNGCEAIVDTWSQRTDPILGLGTITSAMKNALVKAAMAESPDERIRVHTLGLKGLGKLLTRLPAEVVEDELPRAKELVTSAFNDPNADLRQAAVGVIVAAHKALNDEAGLFLMLAPLSKAQTDLLTYYCAKG